MRAHRGVRTVTIKEGSFAMRAAAGVKSRGFTLLECMLASLLFGLVVSGALWAIVHTTRISIKSSAQLDIQSEGRIAFERIMKVMREQFLSIYDIDDEVRENDFKSGLRIIVDMDGDGAPDGLIGWKVESAKNIKHNRKTYEIVETRSGGLSDPGSKVICRNVILPWTTSDGTVIYRPFSFRGSDPLLDLGKDGLPDTGDKGEKDGVVDEEEIGSFVTKDGRINEPGEVARITSIGVGFQLAKDLALEANNENVLVYQGVVSPRNWRHSERQE